MNKTLAALTSAALGLPGIDIQAAVPAAQAQGDVQYGYYQESDDRMKVEIYHGDFALPVSDRLEFTFSIDRDTYSGATPSFSLPETMTSQLRYAGGTQPEAVDAVTAASGGVNAQGLTVLGGINTFKEVFDGMSTAGVQNQASAQQLSASLDAQKQQQIANYVISNPKPDFPATIPGAVSLNFQGIAAAVPGKANDNIGSFCPQGAGCYQESGMLVGTISDPLNISGHIHRAGPAADREIQYHPDSSGIYLRAVNGEAFSASALDFNSLPPSATGPDDYFEILGFNTAANPNLSSGDGTNYASRVAYQKVPNTHTGILALDNAFQNINALWIHYKGNVQNVLNTATTDWDLRVDDINLGAAKFPNATPEQIAWLAAYNTFSEGLNLSYAPQYQAIQAQAAKQYKQAVIGIYRNFLNKLVPANTPVKQVFQKQPQETRTQPVFGAKYYFNEATLALSGGQSNEPDFQSTFGSVNVSHELNDKLTTLSAGYNHASNEITRNTGGHANHHSTDPSHNPAIYPELDETSNSNGFNLGLSQVLNKNSLVQISGNYTRQSGYLSNPYKFVYIRGEITAEEYYALSQATAPGDINWNDITHLQVVGLELFREVRPDLRNQFSVSSRFNQYLPALNAALHLDYRYYWDDWEIDSHTMELSWLQNLPWGIAVTPSLRYYSQSRANFFAPYFLAPRADGHYSSDFRLSGYGALSTGVSVSKQFNRGIGLDLGMEYYSHQGNLKLGGGGESDYADFSYWMVHANLNVALSAPGSIFGGGGGSHHHHGAPLPGGIMYGHMMNQANDIMVGYRYMYANQSGDMLHGSSVASDAGLQANACGTDGCNARPTEMAMHMHMLDLMYAPTDWLNLMLMPQLVDMDMDLAPLPGATTESGHGGGHQVHALGDTLMAALVRVFDAPGHHMHVGLGFSAPTGSVKETLDGRDETSSQLQDYGMQTGSGTWDLKPSVTYQGQSADCSWGAQLSGTKRLESRNDSGYSLGDQLQATAWGGYNLTRWASATVRGVYTEQGRIRGSFNRPHSESAPVDFPANYGGKFWDLGFGLNLTVPDGAFAGHNFSVEWLQPVADKFNGYQLEREGSLIATWNYAF
ncbi:MAG: DUF3570 domain-containing protein [Methylomonas sp.]